MRVLVCGKTTALLSTAMDILVLTPVAKKTPKAKMERNQTKKQTNKPSSKNDVDCQNAFAFTLHHPFFLLMLMNARDASLFAFSLPFFSPMSVSSLPVNRPR
jgi:hypothetical protein